MPYLWNYKLWVYNHISIRTSYPIKLLYQMPVCDCFNPILTTLSASIYATVAKTVLKELTFSLGWCTSLQPRTNQVKVWSSPWAASLCQSHHWTWGRSVLPCPSYPPEPAWSGSHTAGKTAGRKQTDYSRASDRTAEQDHSSHTTSLCDIMQTVHYVLPTKKWQLLTPHSPALVQS